MSVVDTGWVWIGRAALVLVLLTAATAARSRDCDDARLARRASDIAILRHDLAAQPIDDPTVVTPAIGRDLEALKDQLQALVAERLACAPTDPAAAKPSLQAQLQALVPDRPDPPATPDRDPALDADPVSSTYAHLVEFHVDVEVGEHPRIVVITDLLIQCGRDALLAVFEPGGEGWRERLRWRAPPYASIAAAHGDLRVALSPVAADGRWHAVAAVVAPWCSSAWSTLHYVVLRPGPTPDAPAVLLDRSHSIWLDPDDDVPVASADGVELRFRAASIDLGVHNRVFVHRYRFEGERLARVPPVAESERDFVDEWIVAEPDEAMAWSPPEARERLRALKADFDAARGETLEFGPLARCNRDQVEVAVARPDRGETWYFRVALTPDGDQLLGARPTPDRGCETFTPSPESAEESTPPRR